MCTGNILAKYTYVAMTQLIFVRYINIVRVERFEILLLNIILIHSVQHAKFVLAALF